MSYNPTIPARADKIKFSSSRLRGLVNITEEWTDWIRGTFEEDPGVVVEICFEEGAALPGTNVSYLGVWRHRGKTLFEFQLGELCQIPTTEDYDRLISPLITRLMGYRPMKYNFQ